MEKKKRVSRDCGAIRNPNGHREVHAGYGAEVRGGAVSCEAGPAGSAGWQSPNGFTDAKRTHEPRGPLPPDVTQGTRVPSVAGHFSVLSDGQAPPIQGLGHEADAGRLSPDALRKADPPSRPSSTVRSHIT